MEFRAGEFAVNAAFLFPGQGSQKPEMLHNLIPHQATEEVLQQMSETLGFDVRSLDSEEALRSTISVQLALLAAGVATGRVLIHRGLLPTTVLGLSIGAFAAAVVAEAISLADATRLVRSRAEQMEMLYSNGYGLAALVGLSETQVRGLVEAVSSEAHPVFVGNVNAPRQVVIAGNVEGMNEVLRRGVVLGARKAELLDVPVPSHCPLMQPIAQSLQEQLRSMQIRDPQFVYVSNVKARAIRSAAGVATDLADNVAHGVRWHDATVVAQELGCQLFLEMPPSHILSDLVRENLLEVEAYPIVSGSIDGLLTRQAAMCGPADSSN
jgi:malonate decarboxylase epsilon subunit